MLTIELCAALQTKFPIKIPAGLPCFACCGAVLDEPEQLREGTVVVGQAENFSQQCLYFVPEAGEPQGKNVIVYPVPELTLPIYREIYRLLEPERRLDRQLAQLDRAYLSGGLEQLILQAQEFLANPVMLVDQAFNALAMAPQRKLGIDSWDRLLQGEGVELGDLKQAQKVINHFSKKNITSPQIIPYQESDGRNVRRMIAAAVGTGQKTPCGGMEIIELERPFAPQDRQLAERICQLLCHHILRAPEPARVTRMEEQLLYDLLLYAPREQEKLERRIRQLGSFQEDRFYFLAVLPLSKTSQRITSSNLRTLLTDEYPEGWCILTEEQLLLVLPALEPTDSEIKMAERLSKTGERMGQTFFLSMPVHSLFDLKQVWEFDTRAIQLADAWDDRPGCKRIADFFEQVFFKTLSQEAALSGFIHPMLWELKRYDEENNTDLLNTLCVFLSKSCDLNEASSLLYIHRNTLIYRLRRIEKILHTDLKDLGIRQVLSLGCKLMMYQ